MVQVSENGGGFSVGRRIVLGKLRVIRDEDQDLTERIANLEGALNQLQQQCETLLAQIAAAGEREASPALKDADFQRRAGGARRAARGQCDCDQLTAVW
jgi:hypothetical protein